VSGFSENNKQQWKNKKLVTAHHEFMTYDGFTIHGERNKYEKKNLPWTKSSRIYSILLYKFAVIGCFAMIGRCPFFCMDTTASYKLFSRGVNSRPKSLSLWLENMYGLAIGLPSS